MPGTTADRHVADIERLLRTVSALVTKRERDILASFGITPSQLEVLQVLKRCGELTMGQLCQKLHLACSTATDLVDRMERNGLLQRVREASDRRVVRLHLLPKGEAVMEKVLAARHAHLTPGLGEMDSAEKQRLISDLTQLNNLIAREG
ncbi:MAG TPA: MarR family transcriptional regulator [Symbiobacteriaceae bacterium]